MPRRQYGKRSSTTINPASRSAPLTGVSSCHCQTQLSLNCRAASPAHSLTGPIVLCRCSARACTQSGMRTAASSTWECLDEGSPPRPSVEIHLWASILACIATPVDAAAETSFVFMLRIGLLAAEYVGTGRIGDIWADPEPRNDRRKAYYCGIDDYRRFAVPVPATRVRCSSRRLTEYLGGVHMPLRRTRTAAATWMRQLRRPDDGPATEARHRAASSR